VGRSGCSASQNTVLELDSLFVVALLIVLIGAFDRATPGIYIQITTAVRRNSILRNPKMTRKKKRSELKNE
jgi:hypothetical protein